MRFHMYLKFASTALNQRPNFILMNREKSLGAKSGKQGVVGLHLITPQLGSFAPNVLRCLRMSHMVHGINSLTLGNEFKVKNPTNVNEMKTTSMLLVELLISDV